MKRLFIKATDAKAVAEKLNMVTSKDSVVEVSCRKVVSGVNALHQITIIATDGKFQGAFNLFGCAGTEGDEGGFSLSLGIDFINVIKTLATNCGDDGCVIVAEVTENSVEVSTDNAHITLSRKADGIKPVAFDVANKENIEGMFEAETKQLQGAISKIAVAVEQNEETAYGGFSFSLEDTKAVIRGFQTVLMAQGELLTSNKQGEIGNFVLPATIRGIMPHLGEGTVSLIKTKSHLIIKTKMDLWQLPLLDKKFPNEGFVRILGIDRPVKVTVEKAALLSAIDIVTANDSGEKSKQGVRLLTENGGVVVKNAAGSAECKLAVKEVSGEVPELMVSAALTKQAVSVMPDELVVNIANGLIPVSFTPVTEEKTVILLAPINAGK